MSKRERVAKAREKQGGLCSVCGKADAPDGRDVWVEDHDHLTGLVRGAAHDCCNKGIGQLGDDPTRLLHASLYVAAWTLRAFGVAVS